MKNKFGKDLEVVRQNQDNAIDVIEKCVQEGKVLLIENIEEHIDPTLDNLIGRNLLKKGK